MFQVGLYIGEICRYIMAVPPKPEDSRHHIRCMIGNGMRATIWKDFTERFKIKEMIEVYGTTEGNVTFSKLLESENCRYEIYLTSMLKCCSIFWCIILSHHQGSEKLHLHSPIGLHGTHRHNYTFTLLSIFSHLYKTRDADTWIKIWSRLPAAT